MASSAPIVDVDSDVEEQMDLPDVRVGSGEYQIVGIRYYSGVAHPGEYVTLVREPRNREYNCYSLVASLSIHIWYANFQTHT